MIIVVFSAELEGAYLIAVSIAFLVLDMISEVGISQGFLELATPYHFIAGCNLQLNGPMGLDLLVILLEISNSGYEYLYTLW